MEHIKNNPPYIIDSSYKTITVPSDSKHEPEPEHGPEPEQETEHELDVDELVLQFETETNDHLRSLTQVCTNCVNFAKGYTIWSKFRKWINSRSWKLRENCYKST